MKIGFHLYTGSNMEQLAAQYCQCRRQAPEEFFSQDLFTEERIIVPSRCIRQWLERTLADQGVFLANVNFKSMAALQSEILCRDMDEAQIDTFRKFDRKALAWRIMELLTDTDEFEELKNYIEGGSPEESPDLRRFSLSDKIASLFHSYLERVPEYLAEDVDIPGNFWKADHWQAGLWQKLCMDKSGNRLRSPADMFMDFLKSDITDHTILPITVFGAGSMAPASLALLKKLATVTSVNFFCFNPADSQWTQQDRENYENGKLQTEPEKVEDFFRSSLTGQWGLHERKFFQTLLGFSPLLDSEEKIAHFRSWNSCRSDLEFLQRSDSFEKGTPPKGILQGLQKALTEKNPDLSGFNIDDTVTFHNCHNPLREIEILHDHLLHLIEKQKYTNSDIIVAAPDISIFEPYIRAVFSSTIPQPSAAEGENKSCRLHYSFYGLGGRKTNPLADTFLNLLDIGKSRYEFSFVEKLLMTPEVRKRFELGDDSLQILHSWCRGSGIYWGADGSREQYGLPDYENFSWRYGLDRMILGLAVEDCEDIEGSWNGLAPFSQCDSSEGRTNLQVLLTFFRDLQKVEELLDFSGPMEEWKERLKEIIRTFFACDLDRKAFYRGLINAVGLLGAHVKWAGYEENIPLEVIRKSLSDLLSVPSEDEEFLNGSITFCNLHDARSIPCKVLCLLGLDEAAFPTSPHPDSFNLFEEKLEKTYRSLRFQERYFFLESLLGVRDYLLIYYRGQDDVGTKEFSPSTVVTELFQYICKLFPAVQGADIKVLHKLFFYSHSYFSSEENSSLNQKWSYNQAAYDIDRQLCDEQLNIAILNSNPADSQENAEHRRASFSQAGLFPPDRLDLPVTVNLKDLEDFFYNGGYTFLKNALAFPKPVDFREAAPQMEPINPDALAQWTIKEFLSRLLVEKIPAEKKISSDSLDQDPFVQEILDQCHDYFCSRNLLPAGEFGRTLLTDLFSQSWIDNKKCRDLWRANCRNRENQMLQTVFENRVLQLPEQPVGSLSDIGNWSENWPVYSKVILQYSTKKPKDQDQILLTLGSSNPKYKSRLFLRHLFFIANGEEISSYLVKKDNEIEILSPCSPENAQAHLQTLLAFYLYGRKHPVPTLNKCMWEGISKGVTANTFGNSYDDKDLEYFQMLWGAPPLSDDLQDTITNLQSLRVLPPQDEEE